MNRSRRGIAIIIVFTVILALVMIATPFVLSMLQQERTATVDRYREQSTWAAEGARNWAAVRLYDGLDPAERVAQMGTPYADDIGEFDVPLNDARLSPLKVANPTGALWGVGVQDEQAKFNVTTCPERILTSLKTMLGSTADVRDYTTAWSNREAHWVQPQRIRYAGPVAVPDGRIRDGIIVDNATYLGDGARVRLSKRGVSMVDTFVTESLMRYGISGAWIATPPAAPSPSFHPMYDGGIVELEARHPVNVCTARKEVLAAMWTGLTVDGVPPWIVTGPEAQQLADTMYHRRFETFAEWAAAVFAAPAPSDPVKKNGIILNGCWPTHHVLLRTGSVPVCFTNPDTVTLRGRATMNTPAGTPAGRQGFREVLDLSPPTLVTQAWTSQLDFDSFLKRKWSASGLPPFSVVEGWPFGSKLITAPGLPTDASDKQWKPPTQAYVQPATGRDLRATGLLNVEHYDDTLEGRKLTGALSRPWGEVVVAETPTIRSGGVEMWVRFDRLSQPMVFFDLREADDINRLTLRLENNELIFTATDSTLPNAAVQLSKGFAEIRRSFLPRMETWYHLGAFWRGTKWGQMALLVDGFGDPAQVMKHTLTTVNSPTITELSTALSTPSPTPSPPPPVWPTPEPVALANAVWIPAPTVTAPWLTPLLIGNEVIHFDRSTNTAMRAMRNTPGTSHPQDAKVTLFGYAAPISNSTIQVNLGGAVGVVTVPCDRIPAVTGTLVHGFDTNTFTIIEPMGTGITATDTDIPVLNGGLAAFPAKGYILIDQEAIYYDSLDMASTPQKFKTCTRAMEGTSAAAHTQGAQISMWAVSTTNTNNYLINGLIQLDNEWIGPVRPAAGSPSGSYFVPPVTTGQPAQLIRFALATGGTAHAAGIPIIPVFASHDQDPASTRHDLFTGDAVTVVDASNNKETHQVRQFRDLPVGAFGTSIADVQLAGFDAQVVRDYVYDGNLVRILKWPSGELLGLQWLQTSQPAATVGAGDTTMDEVKFFGAPRTSVAMAAEAATTLKYLSLTGVPNFPQDGGAIVAGDEIIGYVSLSTLDLQKCTRGYLNTKTNVLDAGDPVWRLEFLPVTTLSMDTGVMDNRIPFRPPFTPPSGYVLIDKEVIGFDTKGQMGGVNTPTLEMPWGIMGGQSCGLYRGSFGTDPAYHVADALIYAIPWRFWTSQQVEFWDERLPYYHVAFTRRGAHWRGMRWEEIRPQDDMHLAIRCYLRFDGMGDLYSPVPPLNAGTSKVLELLFGNQPNKLTTSAAVLDIGQVDARFVFEFRPGSFWPADSWKRAMKITRVELEYERDTKVLFHEDE